MSTPLKNIIQRHFNPQNAVQPRLLGIFENPRATPFDQLPYTPGYPEGDIREAQGQPEQMPEMPDIKTDIVRQAFFQSPEAALKKNRDMSDETAKSTGEAADLLKEHQKQSQANLAENPFLKTGTPESEADKQNSFQLFQKTAAEMPKIKPAKRADIIEKQSYIERTRIIEAMIQSLDAENTARETRLWPRIQELGFEGSKNAPFYFSPPIPVKEEQKLPTVKIHIGRIEIKAVKEMPQPARKAIESPKPAMSLEKYINERKD